MFGTLVWVLLLLSSILSHYSSTSRGNPAGNRIGVSGCLSIGLRIVGKSLAFGNAAWVVIFCVLQLSNVFDRCECDGGILLGGKDGYVVIELLESDIAGMKRGWIAGIVLATCSAFVYFLCLSVLPRLGRVR